MRAPRGATADVRVGRGSRDERAMPKPVPVANPLQADEGFLRTRLLPGLVNATARNQARGVADVAIFEAGTVFRLEGEAVMERQHVAFALVRPRRRGLVRRATALRRARRDGGARRPDDRARACAGGAWATLPATRSIPGGPRGCSSATRASGRSGRCIRGSLAATRSWGVWRRVNWCSMTSLAVATDSVVARDVPRFPPVRRDLAFVVAEDAVAGERPDGDRGGGGRAPGQVRVVRCVPGRHRSSRGRRASPSRVELRARDRTLTSEDGEPVVAAIVDRLRRDFGAELRSG